MLQHLLQHAAVAAADDQHPFDPAVRQDRQVRQHLVIDELVGLGGLNDTVQGEHPSEGGVAEQQEVLMLGLRLEQHLLDSQAALVVPVQRLPEPVAHSPWPRRCSVTAT